MEDDYLKDLRTQQQIWESRIYNLGRLHAKHHEIVNCLVETILPIHGKLDTTRLVTMFPQFASLLQRKYAWFGPLVLRVGAERLIRESLYYSCYNGPLDQLPGNWQWELTESFNKIERAKQQWEQATSNIVDNQRPQVSTRKSNMQTGVILQFPKRTKHP